MSREFVEYKRDTDDALKKEKTESLQEIVSEIDDRLPDFSRDKNEPVSPEDTSNARYEITQNDNPIFERQEALETVKRLGTEAGVDVSDAMADIKAEIDAMRRRSGSIDEMENDEGINPEFNEFGDGQPREGVSLEKQTESPLLKKALEIKALNDEKLEYQGDIEKLQGVISETQGKVDEARRKLDIDSTKPPLSVEMEIEKMEKTKEKMAEAEKKQGELMASFIEREYGIEKLPVMGAKEQLADKPEDKNVELKEEIEDSVERANQSGKPLEKEQKESLRREVIGGLSRDVKNATEGKRSIVKDAEVSRYESENEAAQDNQKGKWEKIIKETSGLGFDASFLEREFGTKKAPISRDAAQMKQEFAKMHPDIYEKYGAKEDEKSESVEDLKSAEKRDSLNERVRKEQSFDNAEKAENESAGYSKERKEVPKEEQSEEKESEIMFYEKLKERYSKSVNLPKDLSPEKRYVELFGKNEFSEEDESLLKKMTGEKIKELSELRREYFIRNIPQKDIITMRNYYDHKKTDPDNPLTKLARANIYWDING